MKYHKLYQYEKKGLDKLAEQKKRVRGIWDLYDDRNPKKSICHRYTRAVIIEETAEDYVDRKIRFDEYAKIIKRISH